MAHKRFDRLYLQHQKSGGFQWQAAFCCRERAPISSRLNAIDFYLVMCIFLVFGALLEYGVILLLLKKRRKPQYSIDAGLQKMFNNGDAMQPLQSKREMPNSPTAAQGSCMEEAKRIVSVSKSNFPSSSSTYHST